MSKFNIPKREFSLGPKKMISVRMPKILLKELELLAKQKGWNTSELITTALDQLVQWEKRKK